jgi:hypothetical protein
MFLDLQVSQFQFVSTHAFCGRFVALWAFEVILPNCKFAATSPAAMASWAQLDLQLQTVQIGIPSQRLEAESQGLFVDGCQFPEADADSRGPSIRMP